MDASHAAIRRRVVRTPLGSQSPSPWDRHGSRLNQIRRLNHKLVHERVIRQPA